MKFRTHSAGLTVILLLVFVCPSLAQGDGYVPDDPVVKSADLPLYPPLARQARIEGTVQMQVTTDGVVITNLTASGAHKLLVNAAEDNVKTWHFCRHRPQTFTITFVYKLEKPEVYGFVNPTVLLELPARVEIHTKMPMAMP